MKAKIIRIGIGAAVFIAAFIFREIELWLSLAAAVIIGFDIVYFAVRSIFKGNVFNENFLMSIAAIGAFFIGEYQEAAAVMLFYQIGEIFQEFAVSRSKKSIASLMDIRPDYAVIRSADGSLKKVDPDEVGIGDIIIVSPGEKIPLDGTVEDGCSSVDAAALTGEFAPRDIMPGDEALSGCVNMSGVLTIRVTKEFSGSTVSRILDLVENASAKKSVSENFITKFARYYTPAVVAAAALLAVIPPLLFTGVDSFSQWIYRALTFLVVSCPCALVISVPMSFFGGIGCASKNGILIKGGNYLEALSAAETVVFDKTGTLTKGVFKVSKIVTSGGAQAEALGVRENELLRLAAHAENYSGHPVARSLKQAYLSGGGVFDAAAVKNVEELPGLGVKADVDGVAVCVGNKKMMEKYGVDIGETLLSAAENVGGTLAHVAVNGAYSGFAVISDEIKADAYNVVKRLAEVGIKKTVMLTGDIEAEAKRVAEKLGLTEYYAALLPAQKVEKVEALYREKSRNGKLIFVGDGINDAPVLARADVGVAMGALGSDAAVEAADIVVMNDEPSKIAAAVKISRKTRSIVRQNIIFAISVKAVVLLLGAAGIADMWFAVFADVGVAVLAILNALRALNGKI
ncbi:MAG: heavy metal translocating P-type ATPase [Clostridiales bacterium]|jgi:Cd2+/Zn2+-exporting ATPase|nr:heavy metal translocating P-type ATPase [Clostridiales bacterium]